MAETSEINCVYVDTNVDTHLGVLVHDHETVSDFKEKLCMEHLQCFPKVGEIRISAVKVERQNQLGRFLYYHLSDSMYLSTAFDGVSKNCWFVLVDVDVRVDNGELPSIIDADQNCSNNEFLENKEEMANDFLLLDGYTKNKTLEEEDLETEVVEKTKKKRKLKSSDGKKSRKKPSVGLNQSAAASRFDVDQSHELCGNVQVEVVASESSQREKIDDILTGATRKEIEMGEKSVEDVGRCKLEFDNLVSLTENHLDTNSGLTTRPDTEKKKSRKKRSKDHINQSSAAAITTSGDIFNEINGVPANVDCVDATPESLPISRGNPFAESTQKDNEMGENTVDDVGRDKVETDNLANHTESHLDYSNLEKETKKMRKKRSKHDINQSSAAATTTSRDIMNEINGIPGNVDIVNSTSESLPISRRENLGSHFAEARQKENEMGEKIDGDVGSRKAIRSAADNSQTNNSEIDADEAKSVKPTKKKKSKKAKTPAKEDVLVGSGAQNVEPIEVVDGEGTDNVIRNILDSLQERNEIEENLDKTGKKSSKKSKKKHSLKVAESQVLSVEVKNAALEETPPINSPKDTDALFTPAKKYTESHTSLLKKSSEVADNAEDNNSLSKKFLIEKADMGDNFGCSQNQEKQDQLAGGKKSKREKKSLDLHPSGSNDGSLCSTKPKEKKGRVQPAASGIRHLQSMVKNDRSGSVRASVNSKKEDVKKISKPLRVDKRKTNFFENAEKCNSTEDESKTADISTKTPSDFSSDNDSDVTSMSRKQGNNLPGGTNKFSGSLQDILRRSSSYKKALIRAQSQPDISDDEIPVVDCVPDSQAV